MKDTKAAPTGAAFVRAKGSGSSEVIVDSHDALTGGAD